MTNKKVTSKVSFKNDHTSQLDACVLELSNSIIENVEQNNQKRLTQIIDIWENNRRELIKFEKKGCVM